MPFVTPFFALVASLFVSAVAIPVAADTYGGSDGYVRDATPDTEIVVGRDGYPRDSVVVGDDPTVYVVIEEEQGAAQQIDGETVIVVQEPQPIAASAEAPPSPTTVVVEQPVAPYDGAIWVEGYWYYGAGGYIWVDGHYVAPRPNGMFSFTLAGTTTAAFGISCPVTTARTVYGSASGTTDPFFFFGPYFYPLLPPSSVPLPRLLRPARAWALFVSQQSKLSQARDHGTLHRARYRYET